YVLKYASKAKRRSLGSLAFSEVLDKALRNDNPMIQLLKHSNKINDDPNEPAVDDIEVDGINDSDEEDDTPQETYELRTDWMLLAEMMSNRQTRSLDDFSAPLVIATLTKVCYDILKLKRQKASSSKQLVTQLPPICGVLMYSQDSRKSDHLSEVVVPIVNFKKFINLRLCKDKQVTRINNNNSEIFHITYVMKVYMIRLGIINDANPENISESDIKTSSDAIKCSSNMGRSG
ncbi:hypothetical protein GLOIN_2v1584397, partial [Rhizophagus irregularis DAOM 181602=DAOM 197198]